MRTGCSRLHFVLLLALLVPGCASNRSVVSFDLRRWHGPPGRSLVIERGELRVEGRNGPVLTLWARSPEDPRCAAGTVEATGAFRESAASFGSIRLCPTDDGREGWFRWHAEVDSPPGVASARGLPPAFDFAVALSADSSVLSIRSPGLDAQVALPAGAAGAAIRANPELLGAVVAAGIAPEAPDGRYELTPR